MVTELDEIESPALIVDLEVMEANVASMASLTGGRGIQLWPNAKGHKIPAFAWRQVRAGAAGITCQKLSEAEVMVNAGLTDILVAVQIVGAHKVERLRQLTKRAHLITVVDSMEGASAISEAFARDGRTIEVFLEVDMGYHRCGVEAGDVLALARRLVALPGLRLIGVMGYEGQLYDFSGRDQVLPVARRAYEVLLGASASLREAGIDAPRVSVGASAAAEVAINTPGITEVRAGSYLMNDRAQITMGVADEARCAATVLATVISVPKPNLVVIDAGAKALTSTRVLGLEGYGLIAGGCGLVVDRLADEHGMIEVERQAMPFRVGDRVRIIPNSHTAVFNQFAEVHAVRNAKVEAVLPVAARGMMQ